VQKYKYFLQLAMNRYEILDVRYERVKTQLIMDGDSCDLVSIAENSDAPTPFISR
jgi:hypothetical protein